MNFRPVMRLLKRLMLGVLAILAVFAILITFLVYSDRYRQFYHQPGIIVSKQLGWSVRTDYRRNFRQKVLAEPKRVLGLLQNEYPTEVRVAASQELSQMCTDLSDEVLDICIAELAGPSSYNKKDLFEAIHYDSKRVVPRLLALYRSRETVDLSLHATLCHSSYRFDHCGGFWEGLIKIMADSAVPLENRCLAAQALAYMEPANEPDAARKEPRLVDLERQIFDLPEPVAGIARISLDTLRKKESPDLKLLEEFHWIRIGLPTTDHVQEEMLALTDQHDWMRAGLAAELLARGNIHTAIPELRKVAASYWYEPVRATAVRAIAILEGREPSPTTPPNNFPHDSIIMKSLEWKDMARFQKGTGLRIERSHYDEIRGWLREKFEPVFYDSIYWRFLPRVDDVRWQRPGKLPEVGPINIRPRLAIDFAGGKLLGYDEGEFGAGTMFVHGGQMPEFFRTLNVVDFVRMPFGVVIDCHGAMSLDHLLFLATEDPSGIVAVRFFVRLPDGMAAINRLPSGELLIGKGDDAVVIGLKGEICAAESTLKTSE